MRIVVFIGLLLCASTLALAQTPMTDRAAARFLDQATFGPTPASIAALEKVGISSWLKAQFALNTSDIPAQPILDSAGNSNDDLQPVQSAFFQNAVTGQDQLRQRVALALSEIWVVSLIPEFIKRTRTRLTGVSSGIMHLRITGTLSRQLL